MVGLVTMAHLQRALSNHCCYWQLYLLGSKTADAGGARELPLFALKAMSLALGSSAYWATLSLARSNRMWPSVVLLTGVSTCKNDTVRNGRRPARGQLLHWPPEDSFQRNQNARNYPCAMVLVASAGRWSLVVAVTLPRVLATQVPRSQLSHHHLPMHLVSSRCSVLRPTDCHSLVLLVETV